MFWNRGWDADRLQEGIVKAIKRLTRRGVRGRLRLPLAASIEITAPAEEWSQIKGMLGEREFEADIDGRVANELGVPPLEVPLRRYTFEEGKGLSISATVCAGEEDRLCLRIRGGDCDGDRVPLPAGKRLLGGRGPFHGGNPSYPNHVELTRDDTGISRKALILHRYPGGVRVDVPAIADRPRVTLRRPGQPPATFERMTSGAVMVPGDRLVFEGRSGVIELVLEDTTAGDRAEPGS